MCWENLYNWWQWFQQNCCWIYKISNCPVCECTAFNFKAFLRPPRCHIFHKFDKFVNFSYNIHIFGMFFDTLSHIRDLYLFSSIYSSIFDRNFIINFILIIHVNFCREAWTHVYNIFQRAYSCNVNLWKSLFSLQKEERTTVIVVHILFKIKKRKRY